MTSTQAPVRPAWRARLVLANDPWSAGTNPRKERASAVSKSWRTMSVERSRPEEASQRPDEICVPRRQPQPPAEAGCTSQHPVPAGRAVGVSGEQTAACTTLQAQVAFRRARRATVRGLRSHAGQARHEGLGVDSEGLSSSCGTRLANVYKINCADNPNEQKRLEAGRTARIKSH